MKHFIVNLINKIKKIINPYNIKTRKEWITTIGCQTLVGEEKPLNDKIKFSNRISF